MKSVFGRVLTLLAFLGCLMLARPSQAQGSNTYLYIAHAASGRNISAADNPEFPVDISVDGVCIAKGVSFGEIRGPYTAPAATFNFVVSVANTGHPCTNPAVYKVSASFQANITYIGVLTVNASNAVTAQLYEANLSSVPQGSARVTVVNATDQNLTASLTGNSSESVNISASSAEASNVPTGMYSGSVYLEGTSTLEAGPEPANLMSRDVYIYVLAGSASNNSVQILGPRIIRDVF
jgi:hypothetical protein